MALISLNEAKQHLRVDGDDQNAEITNLIASASDLVMDYLKRSEDGWNEQGTPPLVKAAVKIILSGLFDDREGTGSGDFFAPSGAVARILARYRDPALA